MDRILGVRFNKNIGKITYFKYSLKEILNEIVAGDVIIAETKRGIEHGKVHFAKNLSEINFSFVLDTNERILRKATKKDLEIIKNLLCDKEKAVRICKKKILEYKININLIDIEYLFDRKKMIFYFISDSRIDFRNLAKELALIFRVRIELRQLNTRDQAKVLGDLGVCGRKLCCKSFLEEYEPISIKIAKDQGLSLNPTKLSGVCGKLKCCLKFEEEYYEHQKIKETS